MKQFIYLDEYRTPNSKVFTGRDRGIEVRKKSKIDEIENKSDNQIVIVIPDTIRSINPSFLEEFLFNVVTKLKKEDFYKKITFKNKEWLYNFDVDLEDAVDSILRRDSALSNR